MSDGPRHLRVSVDRDRCVGSGNCVFWAPATFVLGDDAVSVVLDPPGDAVDRIVVAAEGCPTRAISVSSEGYGTSGQQGDGTSGQQGDATSGQQGDATSGQQGEGTPGEQGYGTPGEQGYGTPGEQGYGTPGENG